MEILEYKFVSGVGDGDGAGAGYGYGAGTSDGAGYGAGTGAGAGDWYGYGAGTSDGAGYGTGDGTGDGAGYGAGTGDGDGTGDGAGTSDGAGYGAGTSDGAGYKIKFHKDKAVYYIDGLATIFLKIHGNVAKCKTISDYFEVDDCFVVKGNGYFAHGKTVKSAYQALQEKIFMLMNVDDKIKEFVREFNNKDTYAGSKFFEWHNLLTGSCLFGREQFIKNRGLSLKKKYTVKEFINICENSYGSNIIIKLKEFYK